MKSSTTPSKIIPPNEEIAPFPGSRVSIHLWGKRLSDQVAKGRDNGWHGINGTEMLSRTFAEIGVKRLFVPHLGQVEIPRIVPTRDFVNDFEFDGVNVFDSVHADGTTLTLPGDAVLFKSADCPTIVIYLRDGRVINLHGQFSLIEPFYGVLMNPNLKEVLGIIETAFLNVSVRERRRALVHATLGIGPTHYHFPPDHKVYGKNNGILIKHLEEKYGSLAFAPNTNPADGYVNLSGIIKAKCMKLGVRGDNISFSFMDTFGSRIWFSNRREECGRNAVLVAVGD
jgi:copper oxidase (laccase) domain-containing protein